MYRKHVKKSINILLNVLTAFIAIISITQKCCFYGIFALKNGLIYYLTVEPVSISSANTTLTESPLSAAKIIPQLSTPQSFAGLRLATIFLKKIEMNYIIRKT